MTSKPQFPAKPRKTKTVRRLGEVDIAALREAVAALPVSVWGDYF